MKKKHTSGAITEFECGHERRADSDEFSRYQDGLVVHEAGHVLYQYGEYGTALKCMEFSSDCGIVWADRDIAVIEEVAEMEQADSPHLLDLDTIRPSTAAENPRRRERDPHGRRRHASALATIAAALAGVVACGQIVVEMATEPGPRPARQHTNSARPHEEGIGSVVLMPKPDSSAQRLTVTERRVASTPPQPPPASATSAPAGAAPAPSEFYATIGRDLLAGPAAVIQKPNKKGRMITAFVATERNAEANESRMRLEPVPNSHFLATLQSPQDARCTWTFLGHDGSGLEYRSRRFEVAPGAAEKVDVPSAQWQDMTAVVTSDARAGDCLLVEPRFASLPKEKGEEPTASPRPTSTAEEPWQWSSATPAESVTPSRSPAPTPSPAPASAAP